MTELITKYCKRCNDKFMYGDMNKSLVGQMTRKYCDDCITLQHRNESKLYQKALRLYIKNSQLAWEKEVV